MRLKSIYFATLLLLNFTIVYSQQENDSKHSNITKLLEEAILHKNKNGLKAMSYIEKALENSKKIPDSILIQLYETAGDIYLSQDAHELALKFYNDQLILQNKIEDEHHIYTLKNIGNVYYRLNDEEKAKNYWQTALEKSNKTSNKQIQAKSYLIYNNLAILEQKKGNLLNALDLYKQAKENSLKLNDINGLIMAYQNIGLVNFELREFDNALKNIRIAEDYAQLKDNKSDLGNIYYNLGYSYKTYLKNNDSAKIYLLKSFEISDRYLFPFIKKASAELLTSIYEEEKNHERTIHFLKITKNLSEERLKEQLHTKVDQLEFKYEQLLKEKELSTVQERKNSWYIFIAMLLVSFVIILILVIKTQKNKLRNRKVENQLLMKNIEDKNKELTETNLKIIHTSEILDSVYEKLVSLKNLGNVKNKAFVNQIILDLRTGKDIFNEQQFENLFQETHHEFYKKLIEKHPDLTKNELRLCAFLKSNLTSKEIAAITQQSYNSITIARHRLKKKLGLDESKSVG